MKFELSTFFEFPGILILIGIVLLIIAIIIGLLAYRKVDKDDITFSISNEEPEVVNENPIKEVTVIDEPNLVENNNLVQINESVKEEVSVMENNIPNNQVQIIEPQKEEIPIVENSDKPVETIVMPNDIESVTEKISFEPIQNNQVEEEIELL